MTKAPESGAIVVKKPGEDFNHHDTRAHRQLPSRTPAWAALTGYPCYARCGQFTDVHNDVLPAASRPATWLLITGLRGRVPVAYLVCPDCEQSTAYLADELHDLAGVRLVDNTNTTISAALAGWPTTPASR